MLRTLSFFLQTLGWLAFLLLLSMFVLVSTNGGMRLLGAAANRYTAQLQSPVILHNLGGTLWRGPTLQGLTLADSHGPWLTLHGLRVNWQPLGLLTGRPFLQRVTLVSGTLTRLPTATKTQDTSPRTRFSPQNLLPWLPQTVHVKQFVIDPAITGQRHILTATATNTGQPWAYTLGASALQGPSTTLAGTLVAHPAHLSANLRFDEAAGGFVGNLAQLPPTDGIHLTIQAATASGTTTLRNASATVGATQLTASGRYTPATAATQMTVSATVPNLRQWHHLTGSPLAGNISTTLTASGTWPTLGTQAHLGYAHSSRSANLAFTGHTNPILPAISGTLAGNLRNNGQTYPLQAHFHAQPDAVILPTATLTGPGASVSARGAWRPAHASGSLNADITRLDALSDFLLPGLQGQLRVSASGVLANSIPTADIRLQTLNLIYKGRRVALHQPASLQLSNRTLTLSPLQLQAAGGLIRASGSASPTALNLALALNGLHPEALLPDPPLTGALNGTLRVTGTPAAPVLALSAGLNGRLQDIPVSSTLSANWQNKTLTATAQGRFKGLPLTATARLNTELGLFPFRTTLGAATPVQGRVSGNLDLTTLNPALWSARQTLGGTVSLNATVGGTLGSPRLGGTATLQNGSYREGTSGLCLTGITARITGQNDRLVLQSLTATAPEGGSLSGQGQFNLTGDKPLAASLTLTNLHLFCGGLLTGEASGTLTAGGTLAANTLGGALTLGPLNVQVPGNDGTVPIPQVQTVRAGARPSPATLTRTRLNIALSAPNQIHVRGRGLDAEFGGNLTVQGTTGTPRVNGNLGLIRGNFALLGRTLVLADTTALRFNGPIPPSPYLNVLATTTVQNTALTLTVTGPAQAPSLALTSNPPLPQDEALAMLLFGERLGSISPFQALQLAQATRVLTGAGSGQPGFIDETREALGLDTFTIGSDTANNPTLTTGKYVGDDVYLSITQAALPEDRKVRAELGLTPSVSGYTQVDGLGVQTFGVLWKRDY